MAFGHGSKGVFKIQDNGGTLRDISAFVTAVNWDPTADVAETTTLGKLAKEYIAGLTDATIGLEGKWDPTVDGYLEGIRGFATARTFEYYPQGVTTGLIKYAGSCFLTAYSGSSPLEDAGSFTASLQVTAAVTRSVNP